MLIVAGCQSTVRHAGPAAPVLSQGKEQLYQHFDSEVILSGKAAETPKEGAVVVMADGTHVMIPELEGWPRRALGERVSVEGQLERVPTAGAITASSGDIKKPDDRFLLKGVRWRVGKATTRP